MVRLRPVWMTNHPPSVLWHCWLCHQTCKNRRPHNLYCVGADVKPCSINQSIPDNRLIHLNTCINHTHIVRHLQTPPLASAWLVQDDKGFTVWRLFLLLVSAISRLCRGATMLIIALNVRTFRRGSGRVVQLSAHKNFAQTSGTNSTQKQNKIPHREWYIAISSPPFAE